MQIQSYVWRIRKLHSFKYFSSGKFPCRFDVKFLNTYNFDYFTMIAPKYMGGCICFPISNRPILSCTIIERFTKQWIIAIIIQHCFVRVLYVYKDKFVSSIHGHICLALVCRIICSVGSHLKIRILLLQRY